jgi:hypothetical protein
VRSEPDNFRTIKRGLVACCAALLIAPSLPAVAQKAEKGQNAQKKQSAHKGQKRQKIEKLACTLGTDERHARIAIELVDGKVSRFAYYSKWKPRTCSMEVVRDDAFSAWDDTGNVTVVTLLEEKGAFLIDHERGKYHFIFREVDRMRYCGMEGKINGSLTIWKGRTQCALQGVMDEVE